MTTFTDRFKKRPASFSFFSSWEYNERNRTPDRWEKDEWYTNYILGIRGPSNPAMEYGNVIGDAIGTKNSPVKELTNIGIKEYELRGTVGDIHLIGFVDGYDPKTLTLHENKTSDNHERWSQKKVDEHKQIDMYLLLLFLSERVKPEDVTAYLNFIPVIRGGDGEYTCPGTYKQFPTKRTSVDILRYARWIEDTVRDMEEYVLLREADTGLTQREALDKKK